MSMKNSLSHLSFRVTMSNFESTRPRKIFGARHGQIFLLFITFVSFYSLRSNLSMAIVSMTDTSGESNFQVFNWTSSQKGALLGMFFYGYVVANPPLGVIANRLPSRYLLTGSALFSGLLTILFPVIAVRTGFVGCCISRVALGVIQGFASPCASALLAKWSIPDERPQFVSFIYAGIPVGSGSVQLISGYLADSLGGWPSIFYITGSINVLWGLVVLWLVRDSPREHKKMSEDERNFIEDHLVATTVNQQSLPIPWIQILKSVPLWAAVVTGFCQNWGVYAIGNLLPSYLKAIFKVDMKQNGIYSAVPYLGAFTAGIVGPIVSKITTNNFNCPINAHRKIWNSIAQYTNAVGLAFVAFVHPSSATSVVVLLFFTQFFAALGHLGFLCSPVDLSPNFSGMLMGILNGVGQIASFLGPTVTGFMLHGEGTQSDWSVFFLICSGIMASGATIYNVLGSAEIQPWNSPRT